MTRHRRRNPEPVTILLLGAAVLGGAFFLLRKKGPIAKTDTIEDISAKQGIPASGIPVPPGTRAPTLQDLLDSIADPAGFAASHPNVSFDSVTIEQLQAAKDAFDAQQAGAQAGRVVAGG